MVRPLKILHVMRAPVGGLFRHVRDLAAAQAASGHRVGVVYDCATADPMTSERLGSLADHCALGLSGVAMSREFTLGDLSALFEIRRKITRLDVDIVHGHGAKGGALARLAGARWPSGSTHDAVSRATLYTPHGGSLHFDPATLKGFAYHAAERILTAVTDGVIFESGYSARLYSQRMGNFAGACRIVPNGVTPADIYSRKLDARAADFVCVGELRDLKGVDVLLHALHHINKTVAATAVIVGAGPDAELLRSMARDLGLADKVRFAGALPARRAFEMGRAVVVPSRAESFPYVVLEAAAANVPLIATNVGGIPEIVADTGYELLAPGNAQSLAAHMAAFLSDPQSLTHKAQVLKARVVDRFSLSRMVSDIEDFYFACMARPLARPRMLAGVQAQAR